MGVMGDESCPCSCQPGQPLGGWWYCHALGAVGTVCVTASDPAERRGCLLLPFPCCLRAVCAQLTVQVLQNPCCASLHRAPQNPQLASPTSAFSLPHRCPCCQPACQQLEERRAPGLAQLLCQHHHERGQSLVAQHSSLLKQGCFLLPGVREQPLARAVHPGCGHSSAWLGGSGLVPQPLPAPSHPRRAHPGGATCFSNHCSGSRRAWPWE